MVLARQSSASFGWPSVAASKVSDLTWPLVVPPQATAPSSVEGVARSPRSKLLPRRGCRREKVLSKAGALASRGSRTELGALWMADLVRRPTAVKVGLRMPRKRSCTT